MLGLVRTAERASRGANIRRPPQPNNRPRTGPTTAVRAREQKARFAPEFYSGHCGQSYGFRNCNRNEKFLNVGIDRIKGRII